MSVNNNWIEVRDEEDVDTLVNINQIAYVYYIQNEYDEYALCINMTCGTTITLRSASLLEAQMLYAKFKKVLLKDTCDEVKEIQELLDLRKDS